MYNLVDVLCNQMGQSFPELSAQQKLIARVIKEEENSFLRTLSEGLKRLDAIMKNTKKVVSGEGDLGLLLPAGEIFSWLSFFKNKNRNRNRACCNFLARKEAPKNRNKKLKKQKKQKQKQSLLQIFGAKRSGKKSQQEI